MTATFHDQDAMAGFVRGLIHDRVVSGRRVRVERLAVTPGGRWVALHGRGLGLATGALLGGALAAALVIAWFGFAMAWQAGPAWFLWRLVAVGIAGALGGALVGLILTGGPASPRYAAPTGEYVVQIDARDEPTAARVHEALARSGGQLVAAHGT